MSSGFGYLTRKFFGWGFVRCQIVEPTCSQSVFRCVLRHIFSTATLFAILHWFFVFAKDWGFESNRIRFFLSFFIPPSRQDQTQIFAINHDSSEKRREKEEEDEGKEWKKIEERKKERRLSIPKWKNESDDSSVYYGVVEWWHVLLVGTNLHWLLTVDSWS